MKQLLTKLYGEYGRYINEYRSFPHINDGLKIVERRVLYSLYEVAKTNFQKSAKVVGFCIGNLHPHGDQSVYQSLVGMVHNNHVDGQGNFGCNIGVSDEPAAAMRYTEVKSSKHILDNCFEFINYVPFAALELDSEPITLPTKYPICLTGNSECQGMGFGYRTMIPCYKEKDLLIRLYWLLSNRDSAEPIIRPKTNCDILSDNEKIKKILTTGRSTLTFTGKFKVVDNHNIIIYSVPPSKTFQVVLGKFEKEITIDKSLGWRDNSTTSTEIILTILKPRMLKMEELKKKLTQVLTGTLTYECNMCNENGKVQLVPVDNMLVNIYRRYKAIVELYLKDNIAKIQNNIDELILIENMKPLLSQHLKDNPNDIDRVINDISSKLNVELEGIKKLFDKYTLSRIFKIKTDTDDLQIKKKEFENKLANIITFIWKEKYNVGN